MSWLRPPSAVTRPSARKEFVCPSLSYSSRKSCRPPRSRSGPDFEIRHVQRRRPSRAAARDHRRRRHPDPQRHQGRRARPIAAANKLKVVARAGVGLDNVDVSAATKAGVMVVNAPHLQHRHRRRAGLRPADLPPPATSRRPTRRSRSGEWKRNKYTGVELTEKTLGVVGLGRIGVLVAQRMSAFGMKVVAYDPYVQPARAAQMGVKMLSLDELLEVPTSSPCTCPRPPRPVGLIGDEALHKVKPHGPDRQRRARRDRGRGGAVRALKEGRVAGAGLDVYAKEPCTDSPLFEFDNVVATPHLGASTRRGAGEGRHRGRPLGAPRARRRAGAGRGQRPGRRHRRGRHVPACRWPRSSAGSSPRWPARSRPASTSRSAARSPSTT